jgi:hypothetical protein
MKKILRSTAILAASISSLLPPPHSKPAAGRQKKHRTANHAGRDQTGPAPGGLIAPRRDVSIYPPENPWTLSTELASPGSASIELRDVLETALKSVPLVPEDRYPWKREIVTTTFWIGEKPGKNNPVPNHSSAWDEQWAKNYGGTDSPDRDDRVDYRPASFVPGQNPFYVALPYNDLQTGGHKPDAAKMIPWFKEDYSGPGRSVCKGRWIAIRFKDRIAYAQWEDCGPFRTDHSAYVFGDERPKPNLNKGAGLDVSPAVRDYLGMKDTDVTDWKFVDFEEVPDGPWAKFGDNNTFVNNRRLDERRIAALSPRKTRQRQAGSQKR